jgi:two-component system OmpR family response regulator
VTEPARPRVLVVDDETNIADLLSTGLSFFGFDVRTAHRGTEALAVAAEFRPQLLLLDVMLPDVDGFELCRQLRQSAPQTAVIFLTARNRTEDAIAGLSLGGDDYINKPFSLDEVVARIRAVLRRAQPTSTPLGADHPSPGLFRYADLELDDERHEVRRGTQMIELSPTEFALLHYLIANRELVLSKSQILDHVWGQDFTGDASIVESYISSLRKKIDADRPPLVQTVRGIGYCLRVPRR